MNTHCKTFDNLSNVLGSDFAAINYVADLANAIYNKYKGHIPKSEILAWILDGKKPEGLHNAMLKAKRVGVQNYTNSVDYLNYVSDKQIVASVVETLDNAIITRNLTYIYQGPLSEGQQARVRVISNMLWAKIQEDNT